MINRIRKFAQEEVWNTSLHDKPRHQLFLIKQVRIIILAFRGFMEDRVRIRASALTYFSMLSIVPIAAMGFGVAKGFGFKAKMEDFIIENFKGQEEVIDYVIRLSDDVLADVQGGLLAGIGLVVLIWSVMQVLTNIENSFNAIWQIKKPRAFFRKLTDYLSIMMIAPLLVIVSSSVMVYVSTQMSNASNEIEIIRALTPVLEFVFRLLPYALVWLLFTLVYMIMPNTKVKFKYALIAGVIAGTLFQVGQWAYIHFQIGVSKYSALYGTFAALPLFLFWLQLSWLIVLLGAEISFAYQNVDNYEFESESLEVSRHKKRLLSLLITHYIVKGFEKGNPPQTSTLISHDLGIPIRLVRLILFDLLKTGIIVETITDSPKENGYLPGLDINRISIHYVIKKLDMIGRDEIVVKESDSLRKIALLDDKMFDHLKNSNNNILLKDISEASELSDKETN